MGQTIAKPVIPSTLWMGIQFFYSIRIKVYKLGEAVTITGQHKNLATIEAVGLT
jgi:hypothetical protein